MLGTEKLMAFIAITDRERAKSFYSNLGLTFVSEDPFAIVYDANGTTIRVTPVQNFTPHPFTVLGWQVGDIASVVVEMQQVGVALEKFGLPGQDDNGIWTAPGGAAKVAWFKDPDGNLLSVSQH